LLSQARHSSPSTSLVVEPLRQRLAFNARRSVTASPIVPQCAAASRVAHCAAVCCCLPVKPSCAAAHGVARCTVAPSCAAAHGVAHHTITQCCPWCCPLHRHALLPVVLPIAPLRCHALLPMVSPITPSLDAAHGVACRTAMRCCPWCCLLHCRELLPVVLPVAPPCAAAHCVTHRTAVRCCSWCHLSRCSRGVTHHATVHCPSCHLSHRCMLLPVVLSVSRTTMYCCPLCCPSFCCMPLPLCCLSCCHALLPVVPPVMLRHAAGTRVSLWCEGGRYRVVEPAYRTW